MAQQQSDEQPVIEPLHFEGEILSPPPAASMRGHIWRQSGTYLVCKSCKASHGIHLGAFGKGANDVLVGFDEEQMPIFKTLD